MDSKAGRDLVPKITQDPKTEIGLALFAFLTGNPLAALLPSLVKGIGADHYTKQSQARFEEISDLLRQHENALQTLSAAHFKLLNELAVSFLQTMDSPKLTLLRNAIANTCKAQDVATQDAYLLSRLIRDISVEEAQFIIEHFHIEKFFFGLLEQSTPQRHFVDMNSHDGLLVSGLIGLGILVPGDSTIGDMGSVRFSPITAKLIALLRSNAA